MAGLKTGRSTRLTAYTEVLQDGMLNLIRSGRMVLASATAFSLSSDAARLFNREHRHAQRPHRAAAAGDLQPSGGDPAARRDRHERNDRGRHLRQRELDPHPGTSIMNGIGGSGDFARNAYLSIFMTPSTAKGGAISCIVPMVTACRPHRARRADHRHRAGPRRPARPVAEAARRESSSRMRPHPTFRPALKDYFERALQISPGKHTPHLLDEALRLIQPA